MKTLNIALAAMALTVASNAMAADPQVGTGETNGYKLVWQDLFDGTEIDPMRWDVEVNGNGGGNNELQFYTDREENVRLGDDGQGNHCLILTAKRENYQGKSFTSGRLTSRARTVFTHGKIEAAIKFPKLANGLWPAFWMMGNDIDAVGWPKCGEIDIVEMGHQNGINAGTQDKLFNGACHWGQGWPQNSYVNDKTNSYSITDGEYHIFTCIWDDQSIAMYLDLDKYPNQEPYYKMDIPGQRAEDTWPGNYFHKENFILFNLAVGGSFPGIWDAGNVTALNEANGQQASMYINYVKIYQKGGAGETFSAKTVGDAQPNGSDPVNPDPEDPVNPDPEDPKDPVVNPTHGEGPYASATLINGTKQIYDIVLSDQGTVEGLKKAGQKVNDCRVDGDAHNLWIWNDTFATGDSNTYPGVGYDDMQYDGYTSLIVGTAGWSGGGYHVQPLSVTAAGTEDFSHWTDDTRFHVAYRTAGTAPASIAFIIVDGTGSVGGKFAVGESFNDGGVIYATVGPKATDEWQALDIRFADIKKVWPNFSPLGNKAFDGNLVAFLGGGAAGTSLCLDAIYFHTPTTGASGVTDIEADSAIIATRNTVNAHGAIAVYDMNGRKVAAGVNTVGIENLPAGLYIAKAGNKTVKVVK